jgi:hypothetical protein
MSIQGQDSSNEMLNLQFWLKSKGNWMDNAKRIKNRTHFYKAVKRILLDIGIAYKGEVRN